MGGGGKREGGEREKVGVRVDEAKNHVQMNLSTWRERERGGGERERERKCESRGNNRTSIIRFRFQIQCISLEWTQEGWSGEGILVNSARYIYVPVHSFLSTAPHGG